MEKLKSRKLWVCLAYMGVLVVMVIMRRPMKDILDMSQALQWPVGIYVGAQAAVDGLAMWHDQ